MNGYKFAVIDLSKTPINGRIHVEAIADSAKHLTTKGHEEIVRLFTENGQIYYSRNLQENTKTFKGCFEELANAIWIKEVQECE